jgi:uncharacterized membrane protein YtjA (UPF0391 family)
LAATVAGTAGFGLVPFAAPGIARALSVVFYLLFFGSLFLKAVKLSKPGS